MKRLPTVIVATFVFGFIAGMATISGCSTMAKRTLTIVQLQSDSTYSGPFRIDTSQLPSDAIDTQTQTGRPRDPVVQLKLKQKYEFELVLRLVKSEATDEPKPDAVDPKDDDQR